MPFLKSSKRRSPCSTLEVAGGFRHFSCADERTAGADEAFSGEAAPGDGGRDMAGRSRRPLSGDGGSSSATAGLFVPPDELSGRLLPFRTPTVKCRLIPARWPCAAGPECSPHRSGALSKHRGVRVRRFGVRADGLVAATNRLLDWIESRCATATVSGGQPAECRAGGFLYHEPRAMAPGLLERTLDSHPPEFQRSLQVRSVLSSSAVAMRTDRLVAATRVSLLISIRGPHFG